MSRNARFSYYGKGAGVARMNNLLTAVRQQRDQYVKRTNDLSAALAKATAELAKLKA